MNLHVPSLLVVLAAAVVAPLLGELTRRIGLSIVVLELALGVAIGPQGLGWAAAEGTVTGIATVGMAFLFFLAGLEIELEAIRGKPLGLALAGWIACLPLSFAMAYAGRSLGLFDAWIVVAIALATTALGVLVPMMRDSGMLETPLGRRAGLTSRDCPITLPAEHIGRNSHQRPVSSREPVGAKCMLSIEGDIPCRP